MLVFLVEKAWREAYPGAAAGVLVMHGVHNPEEHPELEKRKQALEARLRQRYAGADRKALASLPPLRAYNAYYKRFKKTYHVQLQLESLVFKGRKIPKVAPLVESMFMAELSNLLLTAGHDLNAVQGPVTLDVARGNEIYTTLRGEQKTLKPGDMFMADEAGIISSVLYGPDERTHITAATQEVLFTVYAVAGIRENDVRRHLEDIRDNVLLFAPQVRVEDLDVIVAG